MIGLINNEIYFYNSNNQIRLMSKVQINEIIDGIYF